MRRKQVTYNGKQIVLSYFIISIKYQIVKYIVLNFFLNRNIFQIMISCQTHFFNACYYTCYHILFLSTHHYLSTWKSSLRRLFNHLLHIERHISVQRTCTRPGTVIFPASCFRPWVTSSESVLLVVWDAQDTYFYLWRTTAAHLPATLISRRSPTESH